MRRRGPDEAVTEQTWPDDWTDRRLGLHCPTCAQGRLEETRGGLRFFAGRMTDVYLRKAAPLPGYSMAVWRGRHVADPAQLTNDELASYWQDVATASRALSRVFQPAQVNYLTYGNSVPHLHTYVLLRYLDDRSPGMPLTPFVEHPVDSETLAQSLVDLRTALTDDRGD
jgi:diadenosine tetraphosphate (Ap4A) HIT family hydrolase